MNDAILKCLDSRITQMEMIIMALLHTLGYEAVIDIQDMKAPIIRKKQ